MSRQIVLDTETTGFPHTEGHRIIEIGCVELVDRQYTGNNFHQYLNPEREIDEGALAVHGIDANMLLEQPRFADIAQDFLDYIRGAELLIHNAPFDVGFLDHELGMLDPCPGTISDFCTVTDTLEMARKQHPGARNSLDALCKRYGVDNSGRELHGALLDAELLGDVYLAMTGGQITLGLQEEAPEQQWPLPFAGQPLPEVKVIRARPEELEAHRQRMAALRGDSN